MAATEGTPFYNKQLATQYTEYDVKKADEYLAKAGLGKKDGDGMRLRPDGQPFSFVIEVPNNNPEYMDSAVMMVKYFKAVGIRVEAKLEDRALVYARKNNNDIDAMIWGGEGGLGTIFIPRCFFPTDIESFYAVPWGNWYQGFRDSTAEEPPAEVKKMMDIYNDKGQGLGRSEETERGHERDPAAVRGLVPDHRHRHLADVVRHRQEQHEERAQKDDQRLDLRLAGGTVQHLTFYYNRYTGPLGVGSVSGRYRFRPIATPSRQGTGTAAPGLPDGNHRSEAGKGIHMLHFLLRRLVWMVVTFFVTTMVVFAIIQLPPGDFMTSYVETVVSQGGQAGQDTAAGLRRIYGLDQPAPIQYSNG